MDTEEVRRLPLTMGELGKLLVPHYYKGGLEGACMLGFRVYMTSQAPSLSPP